MSQDHFLLMGVICSSLRSFGGSLVFHDCFSFDWFYRSDPFSSASLLTGSTFLFRLDWGTGCAVIIIPVYGHDHLSSVMSFIAPVILDPTIFGRVMQIVFCLPKLWVQVPHYSASGPMRHSARLGSFSCPN